MPPNVAGILDRLTDPTSSLLADALSGVELAGENLHGVLYDKQTKLDGKHADKLDGAYGALHDAEKALEELRQHLTKSVS
jgi:hypothetical protein